MFVLCSWLVLFWEDNDCRDCLLFMFVEEGKEGNVLLFVIIIMLRHANLYTMNRLNCCCIERVIYRKFVLAKYFTRNGQCSYSHTYLNI